jgi:hypothetical protein
MMKAYVEDLEKEAPMGFLVQNAITNEIGEVYLSTENQNSGRVVIT